MANVGLFLLVLVIITRQSMAEGFHKDILKLTEREMTFPRGQLFEQLDEHLTTMKLILGSKDEIYAGGGQHLFHLNFQMNQSRTMVQRIPIHCGTVKTDCGITVMQPGRDGYPLFVCTADRVCTEGTCCYKDVNVSTNPTYNYGWGEPALLTGDDLYTTHSGTGYRNGVYKNSKNTLVALMPQSQADQRYVKIVERRDKENPLQDKLYAFYTEKNLDQNPDSDIFTPCVSQICMADLGGSKGTLKFGWTSQLSSRLSCGDPSRKLYYTELLDVAVLPSEDGADARVYGLFRSSWETRAVCVYAMSDIGRVFSTSALSIPTDTLRERPGECVQDSRKLSPHLLKYMKNDPEMVDWVKPIGNSASLLVSHRNYSHIQVDRVGETEGQEGHNVLLLSTESGAVHKVLENSSDPFIIAEYHPFKPGTHILSMLLDSSQKKLYVSSNAEVVQIDLRNCSVYGDQCADCILARDPYCGWDRNQKRCSTYSEDTIQDVEDGNVHKCTDGPADPSTWPIWFLHSRDSADPRTGGVWFLSRVRVIDPSTWEPQKGDAGFVFILGKDYINLLLYRLWVNSLLGIFSTLSSYLFWAVCLSPHKSAILYGERPQ